jgi:hypothetical protein
MKDDKRKQNDSIKLAKGTICIQLVSWDLRSYDGVCQGQGSKAWQKRDDSPLPG